MQLGQIGALFGIYIAALPITVLIAAFLSPWVREETVAAMSTSADLIVYAALVYILWPSRAPRFFEVYLLIPWELVTGFTYSRCCCRALCRLPTAPVLRLDVS